MTSHDTKTSVCLLPAVAGTGPLCTGAIGLAVRRRDIVRAPDRPARNATAARARHRCRRCAGAQRPVGVGPGSALAFLLLAALGSLATICGTLGRQADARDSLRSVLPWPRTARCNCKTRNWLRPAPRQRASASQVLARSAPMPALALTRWCRPCRACALCRLIRVAMRLPICCT